MRLFVGIAIPEDICERFAGLCAGLTGTRWVAVEAMHLTLRFIGTVDEPSATDLDDELSQIVAPAFDLSFSGIGSFANGTRLRQLWVGTEKSSPLRHLQSKVESAVVRAGFGSEGRKFKPHVTLARFKSAPRGVGAYMEAHNSFAAGPFAISTFTLFRSHLNRDGAQYEALAEYPLGARTPDLI